MNPLRPIALAVACLAPLSSLQAQDARPRPPAESAMKESRPLKLGTVRLEQGQGPLTPRALDIPGNEVMHPRAITLTLLP